MASTERSTSDLQGQLDVGAPRTLHESPRGSPYREKHVLGCFGSVPFVAKHIEAMPVNRELVAPYQVLVGIDVTTRMPSGTFATIVLKSAPTRADHEQPSSQSRCLEGLRPRRTSHEVNDPHRLVSSTIATTDRGRWSWRSNVSRACKASPKATESPPRSGCVDAARRR